MSEGLEKSGIGNLVRKLESDYISGNVTSSRYVTTSLCDDVNKIYAYLESKHTSGEYDSLGREKPFLNIVLAARNIWFRSTDIDRNNIKIPATKSSDVILSFLATAKLQEWMRRENFGQFLNDWGINSAGFNESVLKFVEKDGRLIPSIEPWNRIICDPIDFKNNPKIVLLEMTEAQLRKNKAYDQNVVDSLCAALQARETLDRKRKDTKSNYIKLYEVHGEFSQKMYKDSKNIKITEKDENVFFQQIHVVSFVGTGKKGEYDDFTLFSGKEDDPYLLTALLPEIDGSIALRGSVKSLFEAQWMMNHNVKSIKDQLDLASKLIFQTADGNFVGQNALSAIETGDILIHAQNMPLTKVDNLSHDVVQSQNFASMWKTIGNEIVGISESMLGNTAPSGTAWRQVDALLQENHSLFEIMTENRGLAIEQMMRQYILPFIKRTQLNNSEEIATTLASYGIDKIDTMYLKNEPIRRTNNKIKKLILNGKSVTPEDQAQMLQAEQASMKEALSSLGSQRFIKPSSISSKTWKQLFKDFEWTCEVDVTGEDVDKNAMTTLNTVLQIVTDPVRSQALNTPRGKFLFNKILELTGAVSPLELDSIPDTSPTPQPNQQQQPTPGGGSVGGNKLPTQQ